MRFNPLQVSRTLETTEEDVREQKMSSEIDEVYSRGSPSCDESRETHPEVVLLLTDRNLEVFRNTGSISIQVKSSQFSITEEWS